MTEFAREQRGLFDKPIKDEADLFEEVLISIEAEARTGVQQEPKPVKAEGVDHGQKEWSELGKSLIEVVEATATLAVSVAALIAVASGGFALSAGNG